MKKKNRTKSIRGIYILPNLFTSMNIFCGFYSIVSSINGKFYPAAVSLMVAIVFDILDGKIARATNTTSRFGIEYDSLADLISFGLAPGLLMYLWVLKPLDKLGWLAAFLFMICGALRLARFNSKADESPSSHFQGLPIPAGAAMNATTVLICMKLGVSPEKYKFFFLIMLYVLSFLMVSSVQYNSFKKTELFNRIHFNVLVGVILIFIFIVYQFQVALFSIAAIYVISGPVMTLVNLKKSSYKEKAENHK